MATDQETAAMQRALELAAAADFPPNPNPRVACVVLDPTGRIVGEAAHHGAGTPHAEMAALALAGGEARGGTAVVTLEPCHGDDRPGRCAESLLQAGIARVVFAQEDPNPLIDSGADYLESAGVSVEGRLLEQAARDLNAFWSLSMRLGRPVVTWKAAVSLDGRVAAADGTSQWITGEPARRDVQRLRAECDAIVVGTGTALADDPHLTVRDGAGVPRPLARQPLRVVVGLRDLPDDAHLRDGSARTVHLQTRDPIAALAALHREQIRHVWLEGGPRLAAAFIRAGVVDEVITYVAPLLLGSGPAALADAGIGTLAEGVRLRLVDVAQIGDDVRLTMFRRD